MSKQTENYDYRVTHATKNYGKHYAQYYGPGTYPHCIWQLEQEILANILQNLNTKHKTLRILDFATGTGRIVDFLTRSIPTATINGVDVSAEMLKVAKEVFKNNKNITFSKGDITQDKNLITDLRKKKINVVTTFRFFLNAQEELRHQALEAFKQISDDFTLIFNIHKLVPSLMRIQKAIVLLKRSVFPVTGDFPITTLTMQYVKDLLTQHGYTLQATYPVAWTTDKMYPLFFKKCNLLKKANKAFLRNLVPSEMIFVATYNNSKSTD